MAVSGRPAQFQVGGEFPIIVPQSLGTASIEYKPYGTQVDFLPIVLGNGNIRLEVRPRISDLDPANGIVLQNIQVPALDTRQVDTAVEMKAGQTFALAGLVQERTDVLKRGLPYVSGHANYWRAVPEDPRRGQRDRIADCCYARVRRPDRRLRRCRAAVRALTPRRPTTAASTAAVTWKCQPPATQPAVSAPVARTRAVAATTAANATAVPPSMNGGMPMQGMPTPVTQMPGGTGYDDSTNGVTVLPTPEADQGAECRSASRNNAASAAPQDLTLPQ